MRLTLFILALLGSASAVFSAADAGTALTALRRLPKDKVSKLALIEARDGTPEPDRWYFVVYDPSDENGLHEFVVAGKEVVASRALSQFAEKIKAENVIGGAAVKIDSDKLAKLARQYAQANNAAISKINYELKKEGSDATPVWQVSCLDENGKRVGEVTVSATKGSVLSHDGFAFAPRTVTEQKKKPAPKFDVYAESEVAPGARATPPPETETEEENPDMRGRGDDYRDYPPPDDRRGSAVGNAARSVGRTLRKILPF